MDVPTFLRVVSARGPSLAWFLGAGASASAGVPTAGDMIWTFKRLLYCSAERKPLGTCNDLGDTGLRSRLQAYFDGANAGLPAAGTDEEYAGYFESAFPDEADRRRFIEQAIAGASPSFGHLAMAALMAIDRVRVVWSTNFDRLVEDAASAVFGGSARLTVASIDTARIALEALNESRWPFLGKLHGDFQSRRLKNTVDELRDQDARLRSALVAACGRTGLVVVGYSGRDASVMDALERALEGESRFPAGLFWLHRDGTTPSARVAALIDRALALGVDAHLVSIATFDELMADVLKLTADVPPEIRSILDVRTRRISGAPIPPSGSGWPIVRLNALRIDPAPASCRLVACNIGGYREVRDAVRVAGVHVVVARRRAGVLAFGRDEDLRRAFAPHGITVFDVYPIESRKLRHESAELGLLYDALVVGLTRERPLLGGYRDGGPVVYVDPARASDTRLGVLRAAAGGLCGFLRGNSGVAWSEAASIRLQYCMGALWLLVEPTVWVSLPAGHAAGVAAAADFVRDRVAGRFNAKANRLLAAWTSIITGSQPTATIRAFGIGDGVDASFQIHEVTGFSRRAAPPERPR